MKGAQRGMKLNRESIGAAQAWRAAGVRLPDYDVEAVTRRTLETPAWVHFGAGNIFRGYVAHIAQRLLNAGLADTGVIAAETFDGEILRRIYAPHDSLALLVRMLPDGRLEKEVVASIAAGLDAQETAGRAQLERIFASPSLQMVSFTITEKGYALTGLDGRPTPQALADMEAGPAASAGAMGVAAALLHARYRAGAYPVAMVSMDNCSRNGDRLRDAVRAMAQAWCERGLADAGFAAYLRDGRVTFPLTMIDKITPRPDEAVRRALEADGLEDMAPVTTARGTYIAPFVNAEAAEYLVVEDDFPAGRPPLERAGVYMADRETVNRSERMKVMTCLNPLHTALAVFGCLLGYTRINEEMRDADLRALVERIGAVEGLPVVEDPGIIRPAAFLREVIDERLPNPYLPDAPQRIATDTSLKIPIRFGGTIRRYAERPDLDVGALVGIPLAIAAWLRYVLGVDDGLRAMQVSPDPQLPQLRAALTGVEPGRPQSYAGQLRPLLAQEALMGVDLCACGLAGRVEDYFKRMLAGPGAVRRTLREALGRQSDREE